MIFDVIQSNGMCGLLVSSVYAVPTVATVDVTLNVVTVLHIPFDCHWIGFVMNGIGYHRAIGALCAMRRIVSSHECSAS